MNCHFPTHVIAEDFAADAEGFTTYTTVKLEFSGFVVTASPKLLGFVGYFSTVVLGG